MKLIINADDFGLTKGVTYGILDSMEKGIVTSTTAMTNGWYFEEGIKEAKRRGIESIGIHLTLTWGKPILPRSEVPTLVNHKGEFHRRINEVTEYNYQEVEKELRAQINRFLSLGIRPTHIDGHHHFFIFDKKLLDIVFNLAREQDIPLRCANRETLEEYNINGVRTTEVFTAEFYQENVKEDMLIDIISKYKNFDTVEVMCHPAYVDEDLIRATTYNTYRKEELKILTSEKLKDFIKEENIQLVNFSQI